MINLEQDFIKFETNGELAYYGYTNNLSASDSDNEWSIRLVTGTGSTFNVQWSNNQKLNFISIWDNKEDYFNFNASASFGLTYSLSNVDDHFSKLYTEWNVIPGYDIYNIYILNERGRLVNINSIEIYNIWSEISTKTIFSKGTDKLKFIFSKPFDLNYTFKIEANHIGGKLSESFNF